MIEGIEIFTPVDAVKVSENIYQIVTNPNFDPEDITTLWEFYPGDKVKCDKRI